MKRAILIIALLSGSASCETIDENGECVNECTAHKATIANTGCVDQAELDVHTCSEICNSECLMDRNFEQDDECWRIYAAWEDTALCMRLSKAMDEYRGAK